MIALPIHTITYVDTCNVIYCYRYYYCYDYHLPGLAEAGASLSELPVDLTNIRAKTLTLECYNYGYCKYYSNNSNSNNHIGLVIIK